MTRRTAATWLIGLYACLLNLCYSCPTHGQEIGRFDARGEVVVTRSGDVLRVAIPTEYGRITVEVGVTLGPDAPPPDVPGTPVPPEPETPESDAWRKLAERIVRDVPAPQRPPVARAILAGLDAVIASPPMRSDADPAGLTLGQKAAVQFIEAAQAFEHAPPAPDATAAVVATMRAGDVMVSAQNDIVLAVRYAKELRKYMLEIANGG